MGREEQSEISLIYCIIVKDRLLGSHNVEQEQVTWFNTMIEWKEVFVPKRLSKGHSLKCE